MKTRMALFSTHSQINAKGELSGDGAFEYLDSRGFPAKAPCKLTFQWEVDEEERSHNLPMEFRVRKPDGAVQTMGTPILYADSGPGPYIRTEIYSLDSFEFERVGGYVFEVAFTLPGGKHFISEATLTARRIR
jgi:hypothetical protein